MVRFLIHFELTLQCVGDKNQVPVSTHVPNIPSNHLLKRQHCLFLTHVKNLMVDIAWIYFCHFCYEPLSVAAEPSFPALNFVSESVRKE